VQAVVCLGKVFDTKRHSNVKRHAKYRRISRYYKGVAKYKAEKLRRRRVLELYTQGLGAGSIAAKLGISKSTVWRDLAKVHRYLKGKENLVSRQESELFRQEVLSWSLKKQVNYLKNYSQAIRIIRVANSTRALCVKVYVDAAFEGHNAVAFEPDLPVNIVEGCKITFELSAAKRTQPLARVYVGEIGNFKVNLETNLSMNSSVPSALLGLRVVDLANPQPQPEPAKSQLYLEIQRKLLSSNPYQIDELSSLSIMERNELLGQIDELYGSQKSCLPTRSLTITLDVDAAFEGRYCASFKPRLPVDLNQNSKIVLKLAAQQKTQTLSRIYVGEIVNGIAKLQIKQRKNSVKGSAFGDLKVISP
jgi:DNA-binding CsgD family transcriptional regulator